MCEVFSKMATFFCFTNQFFDYIAQSIFRFIFRYYNINIFSSKYGFCKKLLQYKWTSDQLNTFVFTFFSRSVRTKVFHILERQHYKLFHTLQDLQMSWTEITKEFVYLFAYFCFVYFQVLYNWAWGTRQAENEWPNVRSFSQNGGLPLPALWHGWQRR